MKGIIMKALIFDVDGTLWDSRQAVAESWEELLFRETGQHRGFTAENISYLFGKPMNEISACLFPELPPDRQLEMGQKCFLYENEYLASHPGELFPGVADTLKKLSLSYPLYIVSNCQSGYIEVFLQGTGLGALFKGHLCYGDTHTSKGQTIRRLMELHSLDDALYIGDTQGDLNACREAKIPFLFAAYGFGQVDEDIPSISCFSELCSLL